MRSLLFLPLCASIMFAGEPASLHPVVNHGVISFRVENHYRAPIVRFEAAAMGGGGSLSCRITVEVKKKTDLHPPGTCSFTTGSQINKNWTAKLVYVDFADGMRWTSKQ